MARTHIVEITGGGPGRWEYEILAPEAWAQLDAAGRQHEISKAIGRRQDRRRRARIKAAGPADRYTLQQIGDRDGWECLICETPVSREFRAPHPCTPSIHHIVEISHGGTDTLDNVALTHLFCNADFAMRPRQSPADARAYLADRVMYGKHGPGRRERMATPEDIVLAGQIVGRVLDGEQPDVRPARRKAARPAPPLGS